jgi:hypothetical protein
VQNVAYSLTLGGLTARVSTIGDMMPASSERTIESVLQEEYGKDAASYSALISGESTSKWNWVAYFFPVLWSGFHGLVVPALAYFVYEALVIAGQRYLNLIGLVDREILGLVLVLSILPGLIIGFRGERWFLEKVERRASRYPKRIAPSKKRRWLIATLLLIAVLARNYGARLLVEVPLSRNAPFLGYVMDRLPPSGDQLSADESLYWFQFYEDRLHRSRLYRLAPHEPPSVIYSTEGNQEPYDDLYLHTQDGKTYLLRTTQSSVEITSLGEQGEAETDVLSLSNVQFATFQDNRALLFAYSYQGTELVVFTVDLEEPEPELLYESAREERSSIRHINSEEFALVSRSSGEIEVRNTSNGRLLGTIHTQLASQDVNKIMKYENSYFVQAKDKVLNFSPDATTSGNTIEFDMVIEDATIQDDWLFVIGTESVRGYPRIVCEAKMLARDDTYRKVFWLIDVLAVGLTDVSFSFFGPDIGIVYSDTFELHFTSFANPSDM